MTVSLQKFFTDDHRRLEEFLNRAVANPEEMDFAAYDEFRRGLLKHISMEEKILLPAAQEAQGGQPLPIAAKLRLDHGALAALMVPPPSFQIVAAIKAIMADHNLIEESPGGLYDICEGLLGKEVVNLLAKARGKHDISVMPLKSSPAVMEATRRALLRAGYDLDDYSAG